MHPQTSGIEAARSSLICRGFQSASNLKQFQFLTPRLLRIFLSKTDRGSFQEQVSGHFAPSAHSDTCHASRVRWRLENCGAVAPRNVNGWSSPYQSLDDVFTMISVTRDLGSKLHGFSSIRCVFKVWNFDPQAAMSLKACFYRLSRYVIGQDFVLSKGCVWKCWISHIKYIYMKSHNKSLYEII